MCGAKERSKDFARGSKKRLGSCASLRSDEKIGSFVCFSGRKQFDLVQMNAGAENL